MESAIEQFLLLFGFTRHQLFIAAVSSVVLLSCLLGGLLRSILLAYMGPMRPLKLTDTISFRLMLAAELSLLLFAGYYHVVMIATITIAHTIYWGFTIISAPVLAYIGAQVSYLIYSDRIEANVEAYRIWNIKMLKQKEAEREAKAKAEAKKKG